MSRWKLYRKCNIVVNYYMLTGIIPIMVSVFLGCTVTRDRIAKLLTLIVATTITISWIYAEGYYKYLHDIFFKKIEKEVFYILSVYHSKRIFNTEDWLIEKIRFYRIKRVELRCDNEYKQSIIEHNRRMDEMKAPKRTRKGIPRGVCVFECFYVPMCKELKKEDRIEISYLKGTNTVVDLKLLPKTELNVELCLEKKNKDTSEIDKYYKRKKIIGTVIFTSICVCIYLFLCAIAILVAIVNSVEGWNTLTLGDKLYEIIKLILSYL